MVMIVRTTEVEAVESREMLVCELRQMDRGSLDLEEARLWSNDARESCK